MKNSFKILAAMAILGLAGTASAQNSSSADGYATGRIISPITITPDQERGAGIDFGNFVLGVGDVTENGGPNVCSNTGMQLTPGQQGTPHAAGFNVSGQAGFSYAFNVTINNSGNVGTGITLTSVTPATGGGTLSGGLDPLTFGGTIHVDNTATAGTFNALHAFTVAVNYN